METFIFFFLLEFKYLYLDIFCDIWLEFNICMLIYVHSCVFLSGILPLIAYGTTIKFFHAEGVSHSKPFLSHNRVIQTASQLITPEKNEPS